MEATLPTLLDYVTRQYWAMDLAVLQRMTEIINRHVAGVVLSQEEIAAVTATKAAKGTSTFVIAGGRAIIPVSGVIAKYSRMVNGSSQPRGTSLERLRTQLNEAVEDPRVESIFLHIESPGGSVTGLADFGGEVLKASGIKPVTAFIDDLGASAAYWIASQANQIFATKFADVGSIGVYSLIVDSTGWAKNEGFKVHILRTGDNKGVGAPGVAITDEQLAVIQQSVDVHFEAFLSAILAGRSERGLTDEDLRQLADGRTYMGDEVVSSKLIDGIMTLEQALAADLPQIRIEQTAAAGASAENQINFNSKESEMGKEQVKPDAAADEKLKQDAATAERERIQAITSALESGGLSDVRNKAIANGQTVTEAKAAAVDVAEKLHAEQIADLKGQLTTANEKLKAIATGGVDIVAPDASDAGEEASNKATADDGRAATYTAAVEKLMAGGMSKGRAHIEAGKKLPNCHKAWKQEQPVAG